MDDDATPANVGSNEGFGDLVRQLRAFTVPTPSGEAPPAVCLEAADALERLAELVDSEGTRAVNCLRSARRAAAALRELVALKDLKEGPMERSLRASMSIGAHPSEQYHQWNEDYQRRLPIAWQAAREALGPNDAGERAADMLAAHSECRCERCGADMRQDHERLRFLLERTEWTAAKDQAQDGTSDVSLTFSWRTPSASDDVEQWIDEALGPN